MYSIDGKPLSQYKLVASRAQGSNMALSGYLDMPERVGKTHHSWDDEASVEPYVSPADIAHGGRTLELTALMAATSKADALDKRDLLAKHLTAITGLFALVTDWGSYQVYVRDQIRIGYIKDGYATVTIPFREPAVTTTAGLLAGNEQAEYNIDGVAFSQLGAKVVKVANNFNRASAKEGRFTAYGKEGYQVTKPGADAITVDLVFVAADHDALRDNIEQLQVLLAAPGTRTLDVDGTQRECFNVRGFRVTDIRVQPGQTTALLRFEMLMALESLQPGASGGLQDNATLDILSNGGESITVMQA